MKTKRNVLLEGLKQLQEQAIDHEERQSISHYALGVLSEIVTDEQAMSAIQTVMSCVESERSRIRGGKGYD